jgi:5-methyltetrahydrofolate--homocysteine methyltransferase
LAVAEGLKPPFYGAQLVEEIPATELFPLINADRLYRARWEMRPGEMDAPSFAAFLEREARPHRMRLEQAFADGALCAPRAVYGYFPCRRAGASEELAVYDASGQSPTGLSAAVRREEADDTLCARFHFPRRNGVSLIDHFADAARFDFLPMQAVTLGDKISVYTRELYARGEYREYLLAHGFAVELTETLAVYMHNRIRRELGLAHTDEADKVRARSLRYSFGYPACPDLADNAELLRLLDAGRIGIAESEIGEMLPEFSTSAFIIHHPDARYA